jgi:hypothetical protein
VEVSLNYNGKTAVFLTLTIRLSNGTYDS